MLAVGVDACKTGWIAVALRDGTSAEAHYVPMIDALVPIVEGADALAIDIPIGLPTSAPRQADVLVRGFVGPRWSSVFLAPIREALEAPSYCPESVIR